VEEFWDMTPRELFNRYNGFLELKRLDEEQRWKRVQFIAYAMMMNNPYVSEREKGTFDQFLRKSGEDSGHVVRIKSKEVLEQFMGIA